jgi:hypothetical protein
MILLTVDVLLSLLELADPALADGMIYPWSSRNNIRFDSLASLGTIGIMDMPSLLYQ